MQRRLQVLKMRGKPFRSGFHDYTIVRGGLRVFPRLVAAEHHDDYRQAQISSGIAELDAVVGGGLDAGTTTLFMGPAGSGKSTLATQYAVAAAGRGERAALFLFDEATRTLIARTTGLGINLQPEIQAGRIRIRQVDPGELSPGEFVHDVRREVDEHHASVVVIDSLNGYLNAMPDVRFLNLQLHELLTYLGQRGVTTLLVLAQHGLIGGAMESPVDITYLADAVVVLRYFESAGQVRQAISGLKKRSGTHERTLRELQFHERGIAIGGPLDEFQGILTGVPSYVGQTGPLLKQTRDAGE
jgi:circadian clock protein KaiC